MPRRQRWSPVSGSANRVYDPKERLLLQALDLPGRLLFGFRRRRPAPPLEQLRRVLVLRLDRIGDLLMSLPAISALRAALPQAHLTLAVGRWSRALADSAPVDAVLEWSAPWVGRAHEGAQPLWTLLRQARALAATPPDLALDLQGDVRANLLLAATAARRRVGYANTGGGYLLDAVVPLDETVSWVEQNRRAVAVALDREIALPPCDVLTPADRGFAARLLENLKLDQRRPLVGLHLSGGRPVKQWNVERWAAVAEALQREFAATLVLTGSVADQPLTAALARALPLRVFDLAGKLGVRETLAVIERLDLFLSPDTGPMHMACAVGTPCVAVFGPSDPVRYFSGHGAAQQVVRAELWCSPCNLIRKPPAECAVDPECLRLVSVEDVLVPARRILRTGQPAIV